MNDIKDDKNEVSQELNMGRDDEPIEQIQREEKNWVKPMIRTVDPSELSDEILHKFEEMKKKL